MKNIQPIQIWVNGLMQTASELDARIINDDLSNSATFYWELKTTSTEEQPAVQLAQGNANISGEDYDNWGGDNDYAYAFIAKQINVSILA